MLSQDLSVWVTLLRDVGFPIVLVAYFLLHFEKKLSKLINTVEELKRMLQQNED